MFQNVLGHTSVCRVLCRNTIEIPLNCFDKSEFPFYLSFFLCTPPSMFYRFHNLPIERFCDSIVRMYGRNCDMLSRRRIGLALHSGGALV